MIGLAVPAGLLIGLSLGALGGGGSILTVPALVYLLGQSPRAATTASLVVVGLTSLAGMEAHRRAGRVRVGAGLTFGVLGVAGSYLGTRLSAHVNPQLLLAAFSGLMMVAAVAMHRRKSAHADSAVSTSGGGTHASLRDFAGDASIEAPAVGAPDAPLTGGGGAALAVRAANAPQASRAPAKRLQSVRLQSVGLQSVRPVRLVVAATVVGLLTGFFGVGGGFVIVPALVLALWFPMPDAVGTSLLVIAVNSAAALIARAGDHISLDPVLLAVFLAATISGTFLGNRVASRVDASRLSRAFTVLLVVVAVYTASRSIPHLL